MTRILVVCLGNICRSPAAEAVLRAKLDAAGIAATVDSAGTGGWHLGDPPYPPMARAASEAGYDMTGLRARRFVPADFDRFDLILAADPDNLEDIEAQRPAGNSATVKLLAPYADAGTDTVPDPYYTKDFDGVLRLIETACARLVAQLQ